MPDCDFEHSEQLSQLRYVAASRLDEYAKGHRPFDLKTVLAVQWVLGERERLMVDRDAALVQLGRLTFRPTTREMRDWAIRGGPDPRDRSRAYWLALGRAIVEAASMAEDEASAEAKEVASGG